MTFGMFGLSLWAPFIDLFIYQLYTLIFLILILEHSDVGRSPQTYRAILLHLYHFYWSILFLSFWLKCAFDVTLWALFWFLALDRSHFRFFKIFAWLPKVPKHILIHLYHYFRTVWYLFLPLCYLSILKYAFWVLLSASFWILVVGIGDYWFSKIFYDFSKAKSMILADLFHIQRTLW